MSSPPQSPSRPPTFERRQTPTTPVRSSVDDGGATSGPPPVPLRPARSCRHGRKARAPALLQFPDPLLEKGWRRSPKGTSEGDPANRRLLRTSSTPVAVGELVSETCVGDPRSLGARQRLGGGH